MGKVTVISSIPNVGIINNDLRFKRMWTKKGQKMEIDKELLNDLMADPGTEAIFKKGYLYIKDAEIAVDLGAEPVGKIFNDTEIKVLLEIKPVDDLKAAIPTMAKASRENLVEIAKTIDLTLDRLQVIRDVLGVDLASAMNIRRQEIMNPDPQIEGA